MRDFNFFEKLKGFLSKPSDTFEKVRAEKFTSAFLYFLILLIIYSAITIPLSLATISKAIGLIGAFDTLGIINITKIGVWLSPLIYIIGFFIMGAWIHLWVYIFGGRKGIIQTLKSVAYSYTPLFVFGWIVPLIPYYTLFHFRIIDLILSIWSLIIMILGIKKLQELSTGKAIGSVLIAILIPLILISIITVILFLLFFSIPPIP